MDISRLPESMQRRVRELEARTPVETVRDFLHAFVTDTQSDDEIRTGMRDVAATTTRRLERDLRGLEVLLAEPQPAGTFSRLIASDVGWSLDDVSDQAAEVILRRLAEMLREVIAEYSPTRSVGQVRPHGLTPDEATDFASALDAITRVYGILATSDPDEARRWAALRDTLRPDDHQRVAQVHRECAEIIRAHRRSST